MTKTTSPHLFEQVLQPIAGGGASPMYRQVKRALLRLLESGRYGPGETLPNEAQISGALQVSIGTLRKAVDELVHEHILIRRQGKGTYVALHSQDRFLFQFFHIEARPDSSDGADNSVPREREYPVVDNITFCKDTANQDTAFALRIKARDAVFKIDNRLSLDGRAVVHDRIFIAAAMFKGLTEKRFLQRPSTIYNLYQSDHGIAVLRAQERVRAASATPDVAKVLGIRAGLPVLEVHRVATTFGEKPVEYRISTVDTRHYDYVSTLAKKLMLR